MTRLLTRLTLALLVLAATYLIAVNTALNLPATRAFLSLPDPDPTPLTAEEQEQLAERIDEFKTALLEAGRGVQ